MLQGKRSRNLFDPVSKEPFKLSRTKLEDFLACPRCFYLDRRLGIGRPPGPAFSLNLVVDHLLKKEFDAYRAAKKPHPLMTANNIDAIPYAHKDLEQWRTNRAGVRTLHKPTNFLVYGAIDDLWVKLGGELIVVDYKATSKDSEITLDDEWKAAYKRQMEIYQWLLRRQGLCIAKTGYFLFANARKDTAKFGEKLQFTMSLVPYAGTDEWVEQAIVAAHKCLMRERLPASSPDCEYCAYREAARGAS